MLPHYCYLLLCILVVVFNTPVTAAALTFQRGGGDGPPKIRALSLDVTGTLLATQEPVIDSYYKAALWARLPNPPSQAEMKQAFKIAYQEQCLASPCFGALEGISGRTWWKRTVSLVLQHAGRGDNYYSDHEFDRYFRRVYQHFGSPRGYKVLEDAARLVAMLQQSDLLLGITSNTPTRHMESVLPMLDNFHDNFHFFTCSQDVGYEKPAPQIFAATLERAQFWMPDLRKEEILHIGDSYEADYCGAKAFGFQALLLDRSNNPSVAKYQTWLEAPDYPNKSLQDVQENTISSLDEVASRLFPFDKS